MNLKKLIGKKVDDAKYRAVATVMKKNFIGLAKKHKDDEIYFAVEKINKAIDERNREDYFKYLAKLKVRIEMLKDEKK